MSFEGFKSCKYTFEPIVKWQLLHIHKLFHVFHEINYNFYVYVMSKPEAVNNTLAIVTWQLLEEQERVVEDLCFASKS
jgi:hypothetical protein